MRSGEAAEGRAFAVLPFVDERQLPTRVATCWYLADARHHTRPRPLSCRSLPHRRSLRILPWSPPSLHRTQARSSVPQCSSRPRQTSRWRSALRAARCSRTTWSSGASSCRAPIATTSTTSRTTCALRSQGGVVGAGQVERGEAGAGPRGRGMMGPVGGGCPSLACAAV